MDRSEVRASFERIAEHFSSTRHHPWPEVEAFVDGAAVAGTALDLGCGNGRHAALLRDRADRVVAVDVSRGLLETCRERVSDAAVVLGDAARLPLQSRTVQTAVYVATIHHLPSERLRVDSLRELERVLVPGGVALVSAWSVADERFDAEEAFDTTIPWTCPDGTTVERYYHVYDEAEFRRELEASPLLVDHLEVSSGNCYARVSSPEEERT